MLGQPAACCKQPGEMMSDLTAAMIEDAPVADLFSISIIIIQPIAGDYSIIVIMLERLKQVSYCASVSSNG